MYSKFFKRAIDITISLILLPFVVVIGVVVAIFIWAEDRGSVFYLAPRRGKYGKIFKMYKFRSMKMNAPDIRNADNS